MTTRAFSRWMAVAVCAGAFAASAQAPVGAAGGDKACGLLTPSELQTVLGTTVSLSGGGGMAAGGSRALHRSDLDSDGDAAARDRTRPRKRSLRRHREERRRNGQADGDPGRREDVWADYLLDHGATLEPRAARVQYNLHGQQTDRCRRGRGDREEPARYGLDRSVASTGGENGQSILAGNVMSWGYAMKAWFKISCF